MSAQSPTINSIFFGYESCPNVGGHCLHKEVYEKNNNGVWIGIMIVCTSTCIPNKDEFARINRLADEERKNLKRQGE